MARNVPGRPAPMGDDTPGKITASRSGRTGSVSVSAIYGSSLGAVGTGCAPLRLVPAATVTSRPKSEKIPLTRGYDHASHHHRHQPTRNRRRRAGLIRSRDSGERSESSGGGATQHDGDGRPGTFRRCAPAALRLRAGARRQGDEYLPSLVGPSHRSLSLGGGEQGGGALPR